MCLKTYLAKSSSNNLVLTRKDVNSTKSDGPVREDIIASQRATWQMLVKYGLMTKEKYSRLTRKTPLTEEERTGFVARQLVETRQGTKTLATILKRLFPDTQIVCSRAANVSDFRKKFGFPKLREISDLHHAHDAYLNIVVGNAYYSKFTASPMKFIRDCTNRKEHYNLGRMFESDIRRDGKTAWVAPGKNLRGGTIETVRDVLLKHSALMTRQAFTYSGGFAKDNLTSARKAAKSPDKYMPSKTSDRRLCNVARYGGHASMSTAFFFLVESGEKKRVRSIEALPAHLAGKAGEHGFLERYCEGIGLKNPNIRIRKIHIGSLFEKDGFRFHVTGKSGSALCTRNAEDLRMEPGISDYAGRLERFGKTGNMFGITMDENLKLYEAILKKHTNGKFKRHPNPVGDKLAAGREKFKEMGLEDQCGMLLQMLCLSAQIPGASADLSAIGEGTACGAMRINKNISGMDGIFLIHQSVTGIHERRINLQTV